MKSLAAVLLLIAPLAAQFRVEKLFGPETPTGPYKHPSCIEALDNGDLVLVYYGGEGEYAGGTAIFMSRKPAGASKWTAPVQIARDPFYALGNGVIWQAPDKTVWLFYVVRFGDYWSTSRIAARISLDRGATWSDPSLLRLDEGWMVRGKPIVLASGNYILPIYHETGTDREIVPAVTTSLFLIYDPSTKKWTPSGRIRSRLGNLQPSPVETSPGHLLAFCRRGGGYGGQKDGWLVRSESTDGGMTWTAGRDSEFPNPNSAIELLRLRSGKLLLIYNDSFSDRTPLTAAVSSDGGRTWPVKRNLVTGKDSFAYPTAVQTKDGRIHLVFTSNNRKTVTYMNFTEDELVRTDGR
jgi:predicted neuraminidase